MSLGLALLASGVWQRVAVMGGLTGDWRGLANMMGLKLGGTPLGVEVLKFAAAQLGLHIGFGVLAWLLGWATQRAFDVRRERRLWLITAWFVVLTCWLLVANATLFPWSASGVPSTLVAVPLLGGARLFEVFSLLLLASVVVIVFLNARALPALRRNGKRSAIYGALFVAVFAVVSLLGATREVSHGQANGAPDIILIGVDSLRGDVVGAGENPGLTPNIDAFIRDGAQMFTDAITPLARTFPSWTSILSGRNPRATSARENLTARESLAHFDTIAAIAQRNAYRTIFATDEVRFSNIDASFGFDQVITPTMGTADFLLGKFNDLPLPNLVANTWLGKRLFPATYANRAAAVTYRPDTFVDWLDSDIEPHGPTLLAVHFTLPHTPYNWSAPGDQVFGRTSDNAYQYSNAVIAADRQFGQLMATLERKGMLRNALVVLLSDHGEALGLPASDGMVRGAVVRDLLDGQRISLWGHGTSVLSAHQYAAVLALRGYGPVRLPTAFHEYDVPVSLIDVAPTVADIAGIHTDTVFDGTSLRPVIAGDEHAMDALERRPRFTETGFRTKKIEEGDYDERSVLGEVSSFFRMNPANGRLEMRPEVMPHLLADKERAVMNRDWLLASIPNRADERTQKYVLVSRRGEAPRRLETAPPSSDEQAYALWQSLHAEYGDELLPPAPRAAVSGATPLVSN
ncbi:MAG TPA: sulfatase-like hydrolase/transferase [Steroidobacteraceae bacterium]